MDSTTITRDKVEQDPGDLTLGLELDGMMMRRNVIRELGSVDVEVDLASIFPVMSLNNKKPDNKTKCENDNCPPPTRVI